MFGQGSTARNVCCHLHDPAVYWVICSYVNFSQMHIFFQSYGNRGGDAKLPYVSQDIPLFVLSI